MKLNSKYFDCIRVKPDEDLLRRGQEPECEWPGCDSAARHPAPRGRGREGQYFKFCLEHVREYNKSYNYFSGMSDVEVAAFQKADVTGHRPTWSLNLNGRKRAAENVFTRRPGGFVHGFTVNDPFQLFGADEQTAGRGDHARPRPVRNAERKCLKALDLDASATRQEIKSRFKQLVKRHHPDHNRGDRRAEDKLREVIQAYNYLREAGLC
jgi:curved DNA-binding protein CbpA